MAAVDYLLVCGACSEPFNSLNATAEYCDKCRKEMATAPNPQTDTSIVSIIKHVYKLEDENKLLRKALCEDATMDEERRKNVLYIWTALKNPLLITDPKSFESVLASAKTLHISAEELLEVARHWLWEHK